MDFAASIAAGYVLFWVWYGGNGAPIDREEGLGALEVMIKAHAANGGPNEHPEMHENLKQIIINDDGTMTVHLLRS